ncbi:MAG: radical SAM protein [Erysipelotrichaceae bacterium]|nr:radical SAM protein [Erysipelotrichaceae bacterium]
MAEVLSQTWSVCPYCLQKIRADITVGADGQIHMEKNCPEHGSFDVPIWKGDKESYLRWGQEVASAHAIKNPKPVEKGCPHDCGLCANHQRNGCCVLLELTNRCNLQCPVCFASAEEQGDDVPLEQIEQQYTYLMEHGGPFNIHLSGGEPTLRNDLDRIVSLGKEKGFSYFQLNTNGLRIAQEEGYARTLKDIGISCVFLQFDSLDDRIYRILRGDELLSIKEKAIENCRKVSLPVVLVPVIVDQVNDHEIGALIDYAMQQAPNVRGIHFQPLSYFGRCDLQIPEKEECCCQSEEKTDCCSDMEECCARPFTQPTHITIPQMLEAIEKQTNGQIKAEHFKGGGAENPYCSFHAAYRLHGQDLHVLQQKQSSCCCGIKSEEAMEYVSRQWGNQADDHEEIENVESSSLDIFLKQALQETFTISGMLFQDAWNLDFRRLQRCYICESDGQRGMIPFCAYNLTDSNGKALYRK